MLVGLTFANINVLVLIDLTLIKRICLAIFLSGDSGWVGGSS